MATAIAVEGLSKRYRIGQFRAAYGTLRDSLARSAKRLASGHPHEPRAEIWALDDVSFRVEEGEVLGVIGRNGAGKSTLLKLLTRITAPTRGRAEIRGRVGSLLEVGTGFHPELTGRENVYLNGAVLGMKRREITRKFDDIVEFSGVEKFMDTPVKRYSSGMYVRLAFSVAAHLEPEILLIDEVLAVGDAEFQRRCIGRMEEYGMAGRTVLFVSHNMPAVARLCDRAILLKNGRLSLDGEATTVVAHYLQHESGASSTQSWPDPATAPGAGLVKLREVRVVGEHGRVLDAADIRRPVGIEITFDVVRHGEPVFPKIKVLDSQGDVAFNALDTRERWIEHSPPGQYVATAWIPGNLLSEGLHTVDVAVCSLGAAKLDPHVQVREVVSFNVHDPVEGDSARGRYTGNMSGVIRPLLEWT
jgi:lipopolysaccharide transport system ATP-binding protein